MTTTSAATRVSEIVGVPSTTFGQSPVAVHGLRQTAARATVAGLPADKHVTLSIVCYGYKSSTKSGTEIGILEN